MKRLFLAALILAGTVISGLTLFAQAKEVPCEIMLKSLRVTVAAAKLNDVDRARIGELEAKGVERCNAYDDKRADDFLMDALRIIGRFSIAVDPQT